jgi:hypothetical protein
MTLSATILYSLFSLFYQNRSFISNAIYLATHKVEQNFTELYFKNPSQLPTTSVSGKTLKFEFEIRNAGNTNIDYEYYVYSQIGDEKLKIQNDRVQVKQYQVITISVETKIDSPKRQKIVVQLINDNQEISYWIN